MSDINAEVTEWVVSFWKKAEVAATEIAGKEVVAEDDSSEEDSSEEKPVVDEVEVDEAEVEKGGPGSGEPDGHPFRGNRYTSGVQSAGHHDTRPGTENYSHHEHLTAASAHIAAGRTAASHGQFGMAREHFNEAAYHASQASNQIAHGAGSREMGHHAEVLYHAAHHAGDAAEKASYLTNKHNDAVRLGRGATVVTRDQLLNTEAGRAATSVSNTDRGGTYGPNDNRLVPEGRSSDRLLTTAELGNAAQGARDNAMAQANLVGAAESAVSTARGVTAPTSMGAPFSPYASNF
jgi:hypothetical protein